MELVDYADFEGVTFLNSKVARMSKKARRLCVTRIEEL